VGELLHDLRLRRELSRTIYDLGFNKIVNRTS